MSTPAQTPHAEDSVAPTTTPFYDEKDAASIDNTPYDEEDAPPVTKLGTWYGNYDKLRTFSNPSKPHWGAMIPLPRAHDTYATKRFMSSVRKFIRCTIHPLIRELGYRDEKSFGYSSELPRHQPMDERYYLLQADVILRELAYEYPPTLSFRLIKKLPLRDRQRLMTLDLETNHEGYGRYIWTPRYLRHLGAHALVADGLRHAIAAMIHLDPLAYGLKKGDLKAALAAAATNVLYWALAYQSMTSVCSNVIPFWPGPDPNEWVDPTKGLDASLVWETYRSFYLNTDDIRTQYFHGTWAVHALNPYATVRQHFCGFPRYSQVALPTPCPVDEITRLARRAANRASLNANWDMTDSMSARHARTIFQRILATEGYTHPGVGEVVKIASE